LHKNAVIKSELISFSIYVKGLVPVGYSVFFNRNFEPFICCDKWFHFSNLV